MQLVNEFTVPAPAAVAFETLSDLQRVVQCMPGAVLDERDGEEYRGRLTVRIGPVGLSLTSTGTVLERDPEARRFVVRGSARDRSGQGAAQAVITMTVEDASPDDGSSAPSSTVRVVTDLDLSGRVAQFGGAAITQVNRRIVGQFVKRLDAMIRAVPQPGLATGGAGTPAHSEPPSAPQHSHVFGRLGRLGRFGERLGPAAAAALAGVLLGVAISRAVRSAAAGEHRL